MGINQPQQPLKAGVSLRQQVDTPEFWGLSFDEKKYVMDNLDQDFAGLADDEKSYVIEEFSKTPSMGQGLQNIGNAAMGAVGQAVKQAPQAIQQLPQQIMGGLQQQAKALQDPMAFANFSLAGGTKALDSLSNVATGLYNLPGDLTNAYMGRNQTAPTQAPQTAQAPMIGGYLKAVQQQNPVASFIGEQAPYLMPFAQATRARYLPSIIEGAATGAVSDPGQAPNRLQARITNAGLGAALPAGLGAAGRVMSGQGLKPPALPQRPTVPVRGVYQALEQAPSIAQARQMRQAVTRQQQEIQNAQAITEQKTYQERLSKLNRMFKGLDAMERGPDKIVGSRAAALKAQVQKQYQQVLSEQQAKFPSQKPKQVKTLKPEQTKTVVTLGVKAYKTGGASKTKFKQALKGYSSNDQFKVNKGIENALKQEKQKAQTEAARKSIRREQAKEKRTLENSKLLEAAKTEAAQLKESPKKADTSGEYLLDAVKKATEAPAKKSTGTELKAAGPDEYKRMAQEARSLPKAPKKAGNGAQSKQSILAQAIRAKEDGMTLRLEYEAEGGKGGKGGERDSSTYRFKNDTVLDVRQTNNGDIILKTINENGQKTTRHLHEPVSGSRIYTAKATQKPARYTQDGDNVIDLETGEIVPQTDNTGTFSSDIRENMENLERVMRKYQQKKARVGDIVKASRDLDDAALEKVYEKEIGAKPTEGKPEPKQVEPKPKAAKPKPAQKAPGNVQKIKPDVHNNVHNPEKPGQVTPDQVLANLRYEKVGAHGFKKSQMQYIRQELINALDSAEKVATNTEILKGTAKPKETAEKVTVKVPGDGQISVNKNNASIATALRRLGMTQVEVKELFNDKNTTLGVYQDTLSRISKEKPFTKGDYTVQVMRNKEYKPETLSGLRIGDWVIAKPEGLPKYHLYHKNTGMGAFAGSLEEMKVTAYRLQSETDLGGFKTKEEVNSQAAYEHRKAAQDIDTQVKFRQKWADQSAERFNLKQKLENEPSLGDTEAVRKKIHKDITGEDC